MPRRYIALSDDARSLAVGDYILHRAAMMENEETGEPEMLLVITDTRLKGPDRTKARYISPGDHIEIDSDISFRFFIGTQRQLRGVIEAPEHLPIRRLPPQQRE